MGNDVISIIKGKDIDLRNDINPCFRKRIVAIQWNNYCTAYAYAGPVKRQLLKLASSNHQRAMDATHDLWCGLCHQHVQVGTAALPALPFILEVLDVANDELTIEILDILLGFAIGSNRQRTIDYQKATHGKVLPEEEWVVELRNALLAERQRFDGLKDHENEKIAEFAEGILEELFVG